MPEQNLHKYICGGCYYIYDPAAGDPTANVPPGTPFESLPEGWQCPECGAPKDMFSKSKQ